MGLYTHTHTCVLENKNDNVKRKLELKSERLSLAKSKKVERNRVRIARESTINNNTKIAIKEKKSKKDNVKLARNKGITLIALIITIIVLLILAGISIVMLTGNNSTLINARWSEFLTEYEKVDEAKKIYVMERETDKYAKAEPKFTVKSLFSTISYATNVSSSIYPVDLNKQLPITDTVETLRETICIIEDLRQSDLTDEENVNLYRVDLSLLPGVRVHRNYVINIASGMLYYVEGEEHRGKIYHTPKEGIKRKAQTEPEPDKPEVPEEPDEEEKDLTIHYLSGYDNNEYTQTVKENSSSNVTLSANKFTKKEHKFLYWEDKTEEYNKESEEDEKPEEGETETGGFKPQTGGYYDIVNKLKDILDLNWESDIIDIIEMDKEEANAAEQTKADIIEYLSIAQSEINPLLTSGMNMTGLTEWLINQTEYLTQLEEYETNLEDEDDTADDGEDDSGSEVVHNTYVDKEENVNMLRQDMWLEAVWTKETITLDANGGKINGKTTKTVGIEKGKQYGNRLVEPVRNGYVFKGWYTEMNGGVQKTRTDIYDEKDLKKNTLYAHWEKANSKEIVTITYNGQEGKMIDSSGKLVTIIQQQKVKGNKIGILPTVQLDGMMFEGWYTEPTGGEIVTENTVITESMTIYARWWNVKLELNGGELFHKYTKTTDIEKKFNQWNPVRRGGLYVQDGRKIGKQEGGWQLPNRGTRDRRSIRKERYVRNPAGVEKKIVSQWKGWYTKQNGQGTKIGVNSRYYNSYGRTLYANWRDKYVITYDANEGKFGRSAVQNQKYPYVNQKYPTISKPKREGYTFLGWYDASMGGNKIELRNANYLVSGDKTLYAHWKAKEFTVTLNANGGKVTPSSMNGYYGTTINLPTPTRTGYKFNGWYTQTSGGTPLNTTMAIPVKNTTIYAQWTINKYKITYDGNGGSTPTAQEANYGASVTLTGTSTRTHYTFLGWYDTVNGGNRITTITMPEGGKTVYAHWREDYEYVIGQEVTVGGEQFFVIENNTYSQTTVKLLAKFNLNTTGTAQQNADYKTTACAFSSSKYWTQCNEDLNTNSAPSGSAYQKAKSYGATKGGTGRLLIYEEAQNLQSTMSDKFWGRNIGATNNYLRYWLGESAPNGGTYGDNVRYVNGQTKFLGGRTRRDSVSYSVRPVLIISKSKIS